MGQVVWLGAVVVVLIAEQSFQYQISPVQIQSLAKFCIEHIGKGTLGRTVTCDTLFQLEIVETVLYGSRRIEAYRAKDLVAARHVTIMYTP